MSRKVLDSIYIARSPEHLYAMVSDVTRMGEWSPACKRCFWDDGEGPTPGSWFTGQNALPHNWEEMLEQMEPQARARINIVLTPDGPRGETRSKVVIAEAGSEFAFCTGGSLVRWGYTFVRVEGGTDVTESWELMPDGVAQLSIQFGEGSGDAVISRSACRARIGIAETLSALKRVAESECRGMELEGSPRTPL